MGGGLDTAYLGRTFVFQCVIPMCHMDTTRPLFSPFQFIKRLRAAFLPAGRFTHVRVPSFFVFFSFCSFCSMAWLRRYALHDYGMGNCDDADD